MRPHVSPGSVQALLHRRPALRLAGLLTPALLWLVLLYLVPLAFLLATAFFDTDSFTGRMHYTFTTENVVEVLTNPAYLLTVGADGRGRGRGDAAVRAARPAAGRRTPRWCRAARAACSSRWC